VDGDGWIVDKTVYTVKVEVGDNGAGNLFIVSVRYTDEDSVVVEDVVFTNTYEAGSTAIAFEATKSADVEITAGQFSFDLYDDEDTLIERVTNAASGKVEFSPVTFLEAGTFIFKIVEVKGSVLGWTYDPSVYYVTVVVEDDGEGQLIASIDYADEEGIPTDVVFTNSYTEPDDTELIVSVEVDKDTIKRTSAAFDGRKAGVTDTAGKAINNVGEDTEHYRYDINFRSTSNVPVDEFVVEDPLEAINRPIPGSGNGNIGQLRLMSLWTPATWGDEDGRMNVWYKTKNNTGNKITPPSGTGVNGAITQVSSPFFPTLESDGWRLWTTIDVRNDTTEIEYYKVLDGNTVLIDGTYASLYSDLGVIGCKELFVDDLGLGTGDYITALRFEFGAVKVGFTSKNYGDDFIMNNNNTVDSAGRVRNTNDAQLYEDNNFFGGLIPVASSSAPAPAQPLMPMMAALSSDGMLTTLNEKGATGDWTADIDKLPSTQEFSPLEPVSFLMSSTTAFNNLEVEILGSASALLAKGENDGVNPLYDRDRDAVLTRVITPLSFTPENPDIGSIVETDSFLEHARVAGLRLIDGFWYDSQGRRASLTFDGFALNLWTFLCLGALVFIGLLIRTFIPIRGKKRANRKTIAIAKKAPFIILALVIAMSLPAPAFAAAEAPPENAYGGTMQVEYRYAAGETPDIAEVINRFGFTYHLTGVSDPILEGELPAVRTYTYKIEGALTEEQKNEIKGMSSLTLTEVNLVFEEEVDVIDVTKRPTNDVDDIVKKKSFTVKDATESDPDRTALKELTLTGVTFSDLQYDKYNRPSGYTATAVYRGTQKYSAFGYYLAEATFMTTEEEEGVEVYVVIASYATEDMPPPIDEENTETILMPPEPEGPGTGLTAIDESLVAMQGPNPLANIINGLVPLGGLGITGVWSFLSFIFSAIAIGMAAAFGIGSAIRKRHIAHLEDMGVFEEDKLILMKLRGVFLRILAIIFGVITLISWIIVENFSFGMVWINSNTMMIGILCAVTVLLCALANTRKREIDSEEQHYELGFETV